MYKFNSKAEGWGDTGCYTLNQIATLTYYGKVFLLFYLFNILKNRDDCIVIKLQLTIYIITRLNNVSKSYIKTHAPLFSVNSIINQESIGWP